MRKPLSILVIEDNEADFLLIERQLRCDGYLATLRRVDSRDEVLTAVASGGWDVVLMDYANPEPVEFLHAIWSGQINHKPTILLGNRKGKRELLALTWDHEAGKYHFQLLDSDRGPANVTYFEEDGKRLIVATNRETNEVAMYVLED